ncbi:hypothetical protein [Sinisalibacter aestuarii]|uniref:Uncharacterized protein n=1 Tax=Sinisalibacter aestuarii TaxID=2949426 RepID=A0ABQ5LWH1_9RHOB|nr:hypothetical protein [Sinisalibacter aestuarii]GKY89329.1 hypothetical protein STA1M1_31980 [Sinisalibacter aestuarii]
MTPSKTYIGYDKDLNGGMTDIGKIIREARVFGFIPEAETCEGWQVHRIEAIWEQVDAEWAKYGFRVANLPDDLREKYLAAQAEAVARARAAGWSGEQELADDS